MAETSHDALSLETPEFTPPSSNPGPGQQLPKSVFSSSAVGKLQRPDTTGNEILDRFLQSDEVAPPPTEEKRAVGKAMNAIDNVHDLQYAVPKTIYNSIGQSNIPPLLQDLYGKLQVARSSHIFPRGSQERVGPYIHWADKGDSRLFGESQYTGEQTEYPIQRICQIVDTSQSCEVSNRSDAALGNDIVVRVLSQAVKLSGIRDFVRLEHVASAQISPSSLIQKLHGVEPSFLSRKVDYCLYLHPDAALERRITELLECSVPFGRSINQTDDHRTRLDLPLISIKATNSHSQEDPLVPLSIWASAGFERAAQLLEKYANLSNLIPTILISVKGPHWSVMFMYLDRLPNGGQPTRKLHGLVPIGSTLDCKDCCALISSLVCLFKWAERKNRQFLETYLPPAAT